MQPCMYIAPILVDTRVFTRHVGSFLNERSVYVSERTLSAYSKWTYADSVHVMYSNRHCSEYLRVCGSAYAKCSLGLHIATTVTVIIIATNCLSNYSCNTNIIMELNEHIEILHSHQQVDKKKHKRTQTHKTTT